MRRRVRTRSVGDGAARWSTRSARSRCPAPASSTSRNTPKRSRAPGSTTSTIHYEQILVPVVLRHWNVEGARRAHARGRGGPRRARHPHRAHRRRGSSHGEPARRERRARDLRVACRSGRSSFGAALATRCGAGCCGRRCSCCRRCCDAGRGSAGPGDRTGRPERCGSWLRGAGLASTGRATLIASAGGFTRSPVMPAARCSRLASRVWCCATSDTTRPDAPARAVRPGTVLVVLAVGREVEVDDARDVVDVDAACGDVGRDERRDLTVRERRAAHGRAGPGCDHRGSRPRTRRSSRGPSRPGRHRGACGRTRSSDRAR